MNAIEAKRKEAQKEIDKLNAFRAAAIKCAIEMHGDDPAVAPHKNMVATLEAELEAAQKIMTDVQAKLRGARDNLALAVDKYLPDAVREK